MKQLAKRALAASELVVADLFWGYGFVAVVIVMAVMGPQSLTWLRFLIAGLSGVAVALIFPRLRSTLTLEQMKLAFWPGIWLSLTITIQTWGLKYTTATKAGFITTLYVLIVPFLEMLVLKRRLSSLHFLYVVIALIGTAMICNVQNESLGFGDVLMLFASLAASVQIFWFALIQKKIKSPLIFNALQCLWAFPIPFVAALASESLTWPSNADWKVWGSFLSLVYGSTFFAFALQVKAQKDLTPSIASLLFLLESPFAALFAAALLNEQFSGLQWSGGVLILLAAGASVLAPSTKT